jgi:hypothetical protein
MFTTAPVGAMKKRWRGRLDWDLADVDLFEINEAFAVVTMARCATWPAARQGQRQRRRLRARPPDRRLRRAHLVTLLARWSVTA